MSGRSINLASSRLPPAASNWPRYGRRINAHFGLPGGTTRPFPFPRQDHLPAAVVHSTGYCSRQYKDKFSFLSAVRDLMAVKLVKNGH